MSAPEQEALVGAGVGAEVDGAADGAGVFCTGGASVDGAADGAAVDGAAVGAVVGASVDGAAVGACVGAAVGASVAGMHAVSHSSPSKPELQTHEPESSHWPLPEQTVDCLNNAIKRFAGEALFGPLIFAEHEADALFTLLPGDARLGPDTLAEHWFCAHTTATASNNTTTICLII